MGIPIGHGGRQLSEFGDFVANELKRRNMKLKELAEKLPCEAPAVSRYMGGRLPPEDVVEAIIAALNLSERKAERLRELSKKVSPLGGYASSRTEGHPMAMMHRRSVRQFGAVTLKSIKEQVVGFGWEASPCPYDDDLAYDLKIHVPGVAEREFVLLSLLQSQYGESERLLRLFRGQLANDPKATQILFFEPFAQWVTFTPSKKADLSETSHTGSVDDWLVRESAGKGRLIHGGNWVAVMAQYLKKTNAVKAYLETL